MATAWLQRIMDGAVLRRLSTEPILVPVPGDAKEVGGVLNPGVVREKDGLLMLYRAVDAEGQSRLRAAGSDDGRRRRRGARRQGPRRRGENRRALVDETGRGLADDLLREYRPQ